MIVAGNAQFGEDLVGKAERNKIRGEVDVRGGAIFAGDVVVTGDVHITSGGSFKVFYGGSKSIVVADYVFDTDYDLMPLKDVEDFIKKEGHLPNMTSQVELDRSGVGARVPISANILIS